MLASTRCFDILSKTERIVPFVEVFVSGFSCTSKSPMNNKRQENKACIQKRQATATTDTFFGIFEYIKCFLPLLVILENVVQLMEACNTGISDANWIVKEFEFLNYFVYTTTINCADYGSCGVRLRMFIIAVEPLL